MFPLNCNLARSSQALRIIAVALTVNAALELITDLVAVDVLMLPAGLTLYAFVIHELGGHPLDPGVSTVSVLTAMFAAAVVSAAIWHYGLRPVPAIATAVTSAVLVLSTPVLAPILGSNTSGNRVNVAGKVVFVIAALALAAGAATLTARITNALPFVRDRYRKRLTVTASLVIAGCVVPSIVVASN